MFLALLGLHGTRWMIGSEPVALVDNLSVSHVNCLWTTLSTELPTISVSRTKTPLLHIAYWTFISTKDSVRKRPRISALDTLNGWPYPANWRGACSTSSNTAVLSPIFDSESLACDSLSNLNYEPCTIWSFRVLVHLARGLLNVASSSLVALTSSPANTWEIWLLVSNDGSQQWLWLVLRTIKFISMKVPAMLSTARGTVLVAKTHMMKGGAAAWAAVTVVSINAVSYDQDFTPTSDTAQCRMWSGSLAAQPGRTLCSL